MITYKYDAANRLINMDGTAYTWDSLGRLTSDGTFTYTWSAAGRLITVTDGVDVYAYRYDGDGNRFARIINGTLITHSLDVGLALPEVLVAYESSGTVWYLHLPTSIGTDDGTAWTYSAADGLGSVRQQLDSSGDVDSVLSYRPFGLPLEGDGGDPYGFTGESYEAQIELLYLRARYYDAYLESSDSILRWYVCGLLSLCGDNEATMPMVNVLLNDPEPGTRMLAAFTLGKIGDQRAIPPFSGRNSTIMAQIGKGVV